MTGKPLKACAALIVAVLALSGCQATAPAHSNRAAVQVVSPTQQALAIGAPSQARKAPASGFQKRSCMGFGLSGGDKAGLVVVMVLLAPIFLVGGLLRIFG